MEWLKSLFPNLRQASIRWSEDDASSLAASVAYYLALSLFPMMLVLVTGLALFLDVTPLGQYAKNELLKNVAIQGSQTTKNEVSKVISNLKDQSTLASEDDGQMLDEAKQQLLDTLETYGSESIKTQVAEVISNLGNQSMLAGPLGFLAAALAAIGVFAQLDRGFDRIWRISTPKDSSLLRTIVRVIRHRFTAFLMLVGLGGMVALLFIVSLVWSVFRKYAGSTVPGLTYFMVYADSIITILANGLLFGLVYRWLPKRPVGWHEALRGGLLASVIWEMGRMVLGSVLIGMKYSAAYGAVGSFIALLLWCYYGVSIIFFGAEYVQVLQERRRRGKSSDPIDQENRPADASDSFEDTKAQPLQRTCIAVRDRQTTSHRDLESEKRDNRNDSHRRVTVPERQKPRRSKKHADTNATGNASWDEVRTPNSLPRSS